MPSRIALKDACKPSPSIARGATLVRDTLQGKATVRPLGMAALATKRSSAARLARFVQCSRLFSEFSVLIGKVALIKTLCRLQAFGFQAYGLRAWRCIPFFQSTLRLGRNRALRRNQECG